MIEDHTKDIRIINTLRVINAAVWLVACGIILWKACHQ